MNMTRSHLYDFMNSDIFSKYISKDDPSGNKFELRDIDLFKDVRKLFFPSYTLNGYSPVEFLQGPLLEQTLDKL